jgi:hypothetical protein
LKARLNWLINLTRTSSPTIGNFVLTIAVKAAKIGVNGNDEACAFMIDLA